MHPAEKIIVNLDGPRWSPLFRAVTGFLTLAVFFAGSRDTSSATKLILFFVAVLAGLRIAPLIARRLLPFSGEARAVWNNRRLLAKTYDSYQWQKLLWMGTGMAVYLFISNRDYGQAHIGVVAFCVSSGAAGLLLWRRKAVLNGESTKR